MVNPLLKHDVTINKRKFSRTEEKILIIATVIKLHTYLGMQLKWDTIIYEAKVLI